VLFLFTCYKHLSDMLLVRYYERKPRVQLMAWSFLFLSFLFFISHSHHNH
jgi:hypothetical protein